MTLELDVTPNPVPSGGTTVTVDGTGGEERRTHILLEGVVQGAEFYSTGGAFSKVISVSATVTTQHIVVEQCVAGTFVPKATATITIEDVPPVSGPVSGPYESFGDWEIVFYDPYDRVTAEGHFLDGANYAVPGAAFAKTADGRYGVFKDGWKDTSQHGRYDPSIISVDGTQLIKHIATRDGYPRVAAITPLPSGSTAKGGVPIGIRVALTVQGDNLPDYKTIANLLWADLALTNADLLLRGEVDFGEGDFDGTVHGFMHRTGSVSYSDQYVAIPSPDTVSWQDEHEYIIELIYGVSCKFFLDGVQIGTTQTSRVPDTTMHVNSQTETALGGQPIPSPATTGYVYEKWRAVWKYVG